MQCIIHVCGESGPTKAMLVGVQCVCGQPVELYNENRQLLLVHVFAMLPLLFSSVFILTEVY